MKNPNKRIRLGVNIDHVATLRQVRGGTTPYPDVYQTAVFAVKAGADQITIHLREDRRHIQLADLVQISKNKKIKLNLEMAVSDEIVDYALKYKPAWVCIVPEKRQELTTEGGLDVEAGFAKLNEIIPKLQKKGIKVSLFTGADEKTLMLAHDLKADAIEFHTGHWVLAKGAEKKKLWKQLCEGAELVHAMGMGVHAGHGLDFATAKVITQLPHLREVNIGHSLICYSIEMGLKKAIIKMKNSLRS